MSKKEKEETQELTVVSATPGEFAPATLQQQMSVEADRRKLITQYIAHHMKPGVDFGTIRIGGRDSKPSLFKPGSEKFLSLFKLTATFRKDSETYEMAGSPNGLFCYVCEIKNSKGEIVGEGRGVAALSEKSWTINSCVKIAQKRAQVDAVLRMGALSDFFTQDLEDMGPVQTYDTTPVPAKAKATSTFPEEGELESIEEYDDPELAPKAVREAAKKKEEPIDDPKPWRNPKSATLLNKEEQKKKIFSLVGTLANLSNVDQPETKAQYEKFVRGMTDINLIEANYPSIISALQKCIEAAEEYDNE